MSSRKGNAGFTVVETLIAMVVLAVVLSSMIPLLIQTTKGNSYGKANTQAITLSQDRLEQLRREPFFVGTTTPVLNPLLTAGTHVGTTSLPGYTHSWTVVNNGGLYNANLLGIEARTSWSDQIGTHTARAFTVKANLNL